MDDQELLFKGMAMCRKYTDKDGYCKKKCPLLGNMCISRTGYLNFKDELPDNRKMARINFTEFTKQFRKMVEVLSKED